MVFELRTAHGMCLLPFCFELGGGSCVNQIVKTTKHDPQDVGFDDSFLSAHVVVPPAAAYYSPRDSDMGLWNHSLAWLGAASRG
jgi:hypothetical protein